MRRQRAPYTVCDQHAASGKVTRARERRQETKPSHSHVHWRPAQRGSQDRKRPTVEKGGKLNRPVGLAGNTVRTVICWPRGYVVLPHVHMGDQ